MVIEQLEIKRTGIDNLVSGYSPGKVEEENHLQTISGDREKVIHHLTEKYIRCMAKYNFRHPWECHAQIRNQKIIDETLLPEEIDQFLQDSVQFAEQKYYRHVTGVFISELVNNSFLAGNNNFSIHTESIPECWQLFSNSGGIEERILHLDFYGPTMNGTCNNVGYMLLTFHNGVGSEECVHMVGKSKVIVHGDVEWEHFAEVAKKSEIIVYGNASGGIASGAKDSIITIHGSIPEDAYLIPEDWEDHGWKILRCKNSVYRTTNRDTLEIFRTNLPEGNKVVFIDKDGKEEIVRDYNGGGVQGDSVQR